MDYDPEFPIPARRENEAIAMYLEIEPEFMALQNFYLTHRAEQIRKYAVHTIFRYSQGIDIDAVIPYLAMNYFDRFVSRHPLPNTGGRSTDAEKVKLLATCCLTIAAKMRNKSFSVKQFLIDKFLNIAQGKILKMELCILNGLNWRMRSITPFCFLDYYYPRFKRYGGFKRRCINEIIVQSQGEDTFTPYRPSVIAVSSFLAASHIRYPRKFDKVVQQEERDHPCWRELIDVCRKHSIEIEPAESEISLSPSPSRLSPIREGQSDEEDAVAETESRGRRPGKEVVVVAAKAEEAVKFTSISEIVPAAEAVPKKLTNFHLKWVTNQNEDLTIPPPEIEEIASETSEDADELKIYGCNCSILANMLHHCCASRGFGTTETD